MEVKKIVEGMTAVEVAEVIDSNFRNQNKILEEDIAKQNNVIGVSEYKDFSEAEEVNVGDVRKYEGFLYECVEATTGAFDASKWKKSSFKKETEAKLSELGSKLYKDIVYTNNKEGIYIRRSSSESASTTSGRSICKFPIKEGKEYLLRIPKSGNDYAALYAFTNSEGLSEGQSYDSVVGVGDETKRVLMIDTKGIAYQYIDVCYTTDGGLPQFGVSYIEEVERKTDDVVRSVDEIKKEVLGVNNTETFEFTAGRQQKLLSFTILKGQTINLDGSVTTITCRTNSNDSDYQTVVNGTVADRDINYVKNGSDAGTLTISVKEDGLIQKVDHQGEEILELRNTIGYKKNALVESETLSQTCLNRDGVVITSGTESTTLGVYDVQNFNVLAVSMTTGNQYTSAYRFFDARGALMTDNNTFPTIVGNGISVNAVYLKVPKGANVIKITYNNTMPHEVFVTTSRFVTAEELADVSEKISSLEQGMVVTKEGSGIAYRMSSKLRQRALKILAVGNSWTKNATQCLPEILTSLGIKVEVNTCYASSASFLSYWSSILNNSSIYQHRKWKEDTGWITEESLTYKDILLSDDWDIITHQQQSGNAGNYASYQPYLHDILSWEKGIVRMIPSFFMHATWAYPNGYVNEQFENLYGSDSNVMYNAILSAYNSAMVDENIVNVMPSTPMIQQVREFGMPHIDTDDGGSHLADSGQFAASCVWAEMILRYYFDQSVVSGISVTDSDFVAPSMSQENAVRVKELAKTIVDNIPFYFPNQKKLPL